MRVLGKPSKAQVLSAMVAFSAVTTLLGSGAAQRLRGISQPVLSPLGNVGMYLTTALRHNISGSKEPAKSREELERDNRGMSGAMAYWKDQAEQKDRQLMELMKFQDTYGPLKDFPCDLIPARVVGEGALPYDQTVRLNAGSSRRVDTGSLVLLTNRSKAMPDGLAIVTSSALVGRVSAAGAFTAQLQLITDPQFKIAARVHRVVDRDKPREIRVISQGAASLQTLTEKNNPPIDHQASGDGKGGMVITDVWRYDTVMPGDLVVCNDNRLLPAPVRIGRVKEVKADPLHPDRATVTVIPDADLRDLREVFVVLPLAEEKSRGKR
jgi:cell shape-determining protein MreC